MVDYEKILLNLVKPLVSKPDEVLVKQMEALNDSEILLYVYANSNDLARLIGRKGSMANALSHMMAIASRISDKKITIKFDQI